MAVVVKGGCPAHLLDGFARMLDEVSLTGRRLTRTEVESRRALGERAAQEGVAQHRVTAAYVAAAQAALPRLPGAVRAGTAAQMRSVAETVMGAVAQAVEAVGQGYAHAQRLAVRREEAARREFVDDLLSGRGDVARLVDHAERFGLRLAHEHAVAVAVGPEPLDDTHPVTRRVDAALVGRFGDRRILTATKEGRLVCVAPGGQDDMLGYFARQARAAMTETHHDRALADGGGEGGAGRVAIGRPHPGPGGVGVSYEEALHALDLASRLPLPAPVLRAADLLVFPVLTRDRQAMTDLVQTVLGPLRDARGGAAPLVETLWVYFDAGCVAAESARRLRLSVRALTYRLERVRKLTGYDPAEPLHRYVLHTAVIGARLLDWPSQLRPDAFRAKP